MAKTRTIAQEVEKVAVRLQLLRRMEDADNDGYCTCCTCGARHHYKEMDGGHYISRARVATKLDPRNVSAQCSRCNRFPDGSTGRLYSVYLDKTFGAGTADSLECQSRKSRKYTRDELAVLLTDINQRIKEQEERIG